MFRIGELSTRTGCKVETIRYYERSGILEPAGRTAAGQRVYTTVHHKRLNFVRKLRRLGFSLDEVRGLLRLVDESGHTCDDVREAAELHLSVVEERLLDLRRIRRVLSEMVASCRGGTVPECPLVEELYSAQAPDRAARGMATH